MATGTVCTLGMRKNPASSQLRSSKSFILLLELLELFTRRAKVQVVALINRDNLNLNSILITKQKIHIFTT